MLDEIRLPYLETINEARCCAHPLHLNLKLTSRISPIIEFVEICLSIQKDRVLSLMEADGPLFASFNIACKLYGF